MIYRPNSCVIVTSNGYKPRTNNLYEYNLGVTMRYKYDYHKDFDTLYQTCSQAAEYNFTIQKGASVDFDICYKDNMKEPMNLTGYSAKCVAQEEYSGRTFTINVKMLNCAEGLMKLYMTPYETSKIYTESNKYTERTNYMYQLDLISPSRDVYRIMQGMIEVVPAAGCGCKG